MKISRMRMVPSVLAAAAISLISLPAISYSEEDTTVQMQFSESAQLEEVLSLYAHLTHRKVWVALGVHGAISMEPKSDVAKTEAVRIIRQTLLEKYGIEVRETGNNETFVSWAEDPRYRELRSRTVQPLVPPKRPAESPRPRTSVPNQKRDR